MNGYIALKAITLNGTEYAAGDHIPADAVLPSRVSALVRTGTIAAINAEPPAVGAESPEIRTNEVEGVDLPIKTEDGVLTLTASREDIVKAIEVLQMNADDAAEAAATIESDTALIIIDACDSRKTVQKAVKARAEELRDGSEDGAATEGGDE
jgi:hypothetical protein